MIYKMTIKKGQLFVEPIFTHEDRIALQDARRAWEKRIAHHRAEGITVTAGNQEGWSTTPERERSDGSIFKTDLARRTRPVTEHHCRVVGYLSFSSPGQ